MICGFIFSNFCRNRSKNEFILINKIKILTRKNNLENVPAERTTALVTSTEPFILKGK